MRFKRTGSNREVYRYLFIRGIQGRGLAAGTNRQGLNITPCLWLLAFLVLFFLVLFPAGCQKPEGPIKVGFVGPLSGRFSDLGVGGRNSCLMAVEQVNSKGGINGREVILITKDDKSDPETAKKADKELIDAGVAAIIGHMTSSMSMAALPVINAHEVLMISPTTSTNRVSGIDDCFLMITPPNKVETDHLARHAYHEMGLRKTAVIYDLSNRSYTEDFYENFRTAFEQKGGDILTADTFTSGPDVSFADLVRQVRRHEPDGLLVVAGAIDTAMICQQVRKAGSQIPFLSCGWAMTEDVIHYGGKAVEGIVFSQLLNKESRHERYREFVRQYHDRFGVKPGFPAVRSYEAARLLFDALSANGGNPDTLKSTILEEPHLYGLQGDFSMDRYGDPQRQRYVITVQEGRFKTL